jgi:ABC-type Fe3+ transport system permease subunit
VRRPAEWHALWASLWISLATVVLSAAVGVPLAFLFERTEFPGRRALGTLVALPVALPPLVGVLAFLFLYGESGFASRAVQAALATRARAVAASRAAAILSCTRTRCTSTSTSSRARVSRGSTALPRGRREPRRLAGADAAHGHLPLLRPALGAPRC